VPKPRRIVNPFDKLVYQNGITNPRSLKQWGATQNDVVLGALEFARKALRCGWSTRFKVSQLSEEWAILHQSLMSLLAFDEGRRIVPTTLRIHQTKPRDPFPMEKP